MCLICSWLNYVKDPSRTVLYSFTQNFQVNMGEQMEMFTNGLFPATRHRVVVPATEVDRNKSRQSFAFFNGAHDDCTVEPIHGQEPIKEEYEPINAKKHITQKFKATLDNFKD